MKKTLIGIALLSWFLPVFSQGPRPSTPATFRDVEASRVRLPNGWALTPAGTSLPLGDLPLNIAVSPSRKYVAVTNNGQSIQSIQLFDVRGGGGVMDALSLAVGGVTDTLPSNSWTVWR